MGRTVALRCPECGQRDNHYEREAKSKRPVYDPSANAIYRYIACNVCSRTFATVEVVIGGVVADIIEKEVGEF